MKTLISVLIILLCASSTLISQVEPQKYDIKTAYVYSKESLLISDADLNCSYFIGKKINRDMVISGSEHQNIQRLDYSDGDNLYINKGAKDGIREGDVLLVLQKGSKVTNPLNYKNLGILYLKKAICEVTCLYEDRAIITIKRCCHPVNIDDIVVPFKRERRVIKRKPVYAKCRLPESPVEGYVVYMNEDVNLEREISGPGRYVTIDLGKALVSKADFILFYRVYKPKLPPVIVGTGIIINSQNTNSTVKILDCSYPIQIGTRVTILPESEQQIAIDDDGIPIVDKLTKEQMEQRQKELQIEGGEKIEIDIAFDFDSAKLGEAFIPELQKVKDFITDKAQYVVILRGYTCTIGNEEYNLKLSQNRVEAIKEYLVSELGINGELVETFYYGESESLFDNSQEAERKKNRLVKIEVTAK